MFGSGYSFSVNQCGRVTTVSKKAMILTPLYYFPLVVLFVLVIAKLALKSDMMHKIRLVTRL